MTQERRKYSKEFKLEAIRWTGCGLQASLRCLIPRMPLVYEHQYQAAQHNYANRTVHACNAEPVYQHAAEQTADGHAKSQ
ncbi:MAG: hypothetical protein C0391_02275, partial [Anaerolinea sp.]|nr:hypothetical protein [Anaerolinea sp.]